MNGVIVRQVAWYCVFLVSPSACYLVAALMLPRPDTVTAPGQVVAITAAAAWSTSALFAIPNLLGLCLGWPDRRTQEASEAMKVGGWPSGVTLVVCYVSYGEHVDVLRAAVDETIGVLTACGADFRVEVVTDVPVDLGIVGVHYRVVPETYHTPSGTKYKARALHYACRRRGRCPSGTWVLHLDEESRLTLSAAAGIRRFALRHAGEHVVGQGEIHYRGSGNRHWLIDAADAVRAGDDMGRFRFQYRVLGRPLFGIHGSYVLLPAGLERDLGFDVGERGSLTEDAYFAFEAWRRGVRFDWVDGPILEQSPHGVRDFIRQRRRWFCGLRRLATDSRFPPRLRLVMCLAVGMWSISWSCIPLAVAHLFVFRGHVPPIWAASLAIVAGSFVSTYLVGAYRNSGGSLRAVLRTVVLLPAAAMLEGVAVLYAVARPVRDFHVVRKKA